MLLVLQMLLQWFLFAREYNIRLVIKNSGHDFLGRSTGAHSLSIWTRHLLEFEIQDTFVPSEYINASDPVPEDAVTVGSGWPAVPLLEALAPHGKVAITGGDQTVGLGGYLSGGGHSLLSGWKGLGSDQILEARVVTADGSLKIVNQYQNQDLCWALKGVSCRYSIKRSLGQLHFTDFLSSRRSLQLRCCGIIHCEDIFYPFN